MFGDNTARNDKFHRSIIDPMTLVHVQLHSQVLKAATVLKTDCQFEGSWGIVSMLKPLQEQLQRRHRQRCLKIDILIGLLMFFGRSFYRFQCQQETVCRHHFWYTRYHVPPLQSCGIAKCLLSFLSALECPIIHGVR